MVEVDEPLHEVRMPELTENDRAIGRHIAEIIEDGATIQMGIGSIPNAVLASLGDHKDLGVHTEMFSDGVIPLVENGRDQRPPQGKASGPNGRGLCDGHQKALRLYRRQPAGPDARYRLC